VGDVIVSAIDGSLGHAEKLVTTLNKYIAVVGSSGTEWVRMHEVSLGDRCRVTPKKFARHRG
jgi:hypothetical protein